MVIGEPRMNWEAIGTRIRGGIATLRSRLKFKLIIRLVVGTTAIGLLLIGAEAAWRAKLVSPLERMPTALYTRPLPWGSEGGRGGPISIGAIEDPIAEERVPIGRGQVPDQLVEAILAVEDQRFYQHFGLDFRRIAGALAANVRAGEIVQGGSTITQQLVKNLFLSADRTPLRKLREAAIAMVLEARYDKTTILEAYLNEIYLGQDGSRSIHGVGAAARYYFGKDVRKISLPESALLAAMIQAPNRFSPIRHDRAARHRRNLVLALMTDQDRITKSAAYQAVKARVGTRAYSASTLDARYFRDAVAANRPGGLPSRGAAVYTTLDAALQRAAERAVQDGLARLGARDAQAALVAIDPRNGDVLAMVGGRDYSTSQFNRATDARRQPGSAFKPVVALAALHMDGGHAPAFTLASRVEDEPLSVATPNGRWEPANYDRSFRGEVTVREAIEQSLNVPFARIGLEIGPERIVATARRLGFTSPLRPVPSLALGSSEVTLVELVRAYGVFATGGRLASTRMVLGRSVLGSGRPDPEPGRVAQVADPAEAYLVTSALEGVIRRGTGRALDVGGRFGSIAGKTGTTNDGRDAWFVAYSPSLVVGVWVGFDDARSVGFSGAGAALPIVARFLDRAEPQDPEAAFPEPDGVEWASVRGGESGWSWDCGGREVFLRGTAPESDCDGSEPRNRDDDRRSDWVERVEGRARRTVAEQFGRLLERAAEARHRLESGRSFRFRWRQ